MVSKLTLNDQPSVIIIVIETKVKEKIWIQVRDANRKNTYYTKRYGFVDGKETFKVLMPQAPTEAIVMVFNDNNGMLRNDDSFKVTEVTALPYKLPRYNLSLLPVAIFATARVILRVTKVSPRLGDSWLNKIPFVACTPYASR